MSCKVCSLPTAACCRAAGLVIPVTPADHERLGYLFQESVMPRRASGECVLLNEDDSCSVYERRPQACRDQDPGVCERGAFSRG